MAITGSDKVIPHLNLLTDEQKGGIHEYSIKILLSTGIRVDSPEARKILRKAGTAIEKNNRIFLSRELVDWAIKAAPSDLTLFNRSGKPAFIIGANYLDKTRFGIGVTNIHYQEPGSGKVVKFLRKHMEVSARLGEVLPNIDVISTIGIPSDVSSDISDLYGVLDMYVNTEKPLIILVLKDKTISKVFDLLEHLHGDISEKPFVLPYINPITPLVLNESSVEKMIATIQRGLPIIFSNYSMYGATTPYSSVGTIALLNAELLAGLVLSQLIKEGTPIVLGSLPAGFDMATMSNIYTQQSFLMNLACAEMMEYYRIPHCGTSGSGNGWGPDLPASNTLWMNHLTSCLGKVGMAPFVGSNFDSLVFSPTSAVYADKIIKMSKNFASGFLMDEKSAVLDEIDSAGPGGDFLTSESTLKNYRKEIENNPVWPGKTLEKWMNEGNPKAIDLLEKHTLNLIDNLVTPPNYQELISKGEGFIKKAASRIE
ncbi:MAG: trimethylamine methyltransferase family protein [Bacteroidales bacterium]|nr:trimethylamine methyltransferase family protein [Bacteroidales bacterium]